MSTLFVLKVENETTAQQMIGTLKRLQEQQLIKVDDAATVTLDANGKPKIRQANNLVGVGTLGGAFWGLLIGLLFFVPVFGALVGAAAGAISAKFADIGISDDFIKKVSSSIHPGESALFLMTREAVIDKVLPEMKKFKFELIQSSLSHEGEAHLREMFSAAEASK